MFDLIAKDHADTMLAGSTYKLHRTDLEDMTKEQLIDLAFSLGDAVEDHPQAIEELETESANRLADADALRDKLEDIKRDYEKVWAELDTFDTSDETYADLMIFMSDLDNSINAD